MTITPEMGYGVEEVIVVDSEGTEIPVTRKDDGTWSFTMPENDVTIQVKFLETYLLCHHGDDCPLHVFEDLGLLTWYHNGVHFAIEHGLMNGIAEGVFDPEGVSSRAMAVTVLWRMAGKPTVEQTMSFTDVSEDDWFAPAVRWANAEGIVKGYDDMFFGPDDPITREQLAVILYRFAAYLGLDTTVKNSDVLSTFSDADQISDWAVEAITWMVDAGLMKGVSDDMLDPAAESNRAQLATLLMELDAYIEATKDTAED